MPRAETRIVSVTAKHGYTRTHLDTFTDGRSLKDMIEAELDNWADELRMGVNLINVKVHMEGGQQLNLRAKVLVTVELDQDSVAKLSMPPKRKKKRKPFEIEFGDDFHNYLCEARIGSMNRNNMKVSQLKIEGYLTNENEVTEAGHVVLDEFESRSIDEMGTWVCVSLLYVTKNGVLKTYALDYLTKYSMIRSVKAYSWGSTKLAVTHKAAMWLGKNVTRLMTDHPERMNLLSEALKYYPYEDLAEPLASDYTWIRDSAKLRAAQLERQLAGARRAGIELQIEQHWEQPTELTQADIDSIRELVSMLVLVGDSDPVQNAVHAYVNETEDLL